MWADFRQTLGYDISEVPEGLLERFRLGAVRDNPMLQCIPKIFGLIGNLMEFKERWKLAGPLLGGFMKCPTELALVAPIEQVPGLPVGFIVMTEVMDLRLFFNNKTQAIKGGYVYLTAPMKNKPLRMCVNMQKALSLYFSRECGMMEGNIIVPIPEADFHFPVLPALPRRNLDWRVLTEDTCLPCTTKQTPPD